MSLRTSVQSHSYWVALYVDIQGYSKKLKKEFIPPELYTTIHRKNVSNNPKKNSLPYCTFSSSTMSGQSLPFSE